MPKNRISEKHVSAKNRVRPIFSAMSVAHVDEEEEEKKQNRSSSSSYCTDRVLSNGDFYTGEWASRAPHGVGKYIWTDGCMYEGEWSGGKITGRGKFSWPSAATYDGEFSSGFLHGFGTCVGSTGDTYCGSWLLNLKHGRGRKSYANGDCYDGEWRWGWQDGQGKYIWANGNEYEGEWKNGQIFGKGSMLWANGNRYVGSWENGLPKGESRFFWADGSFYVGNWRKDPNVLSGNYYPSSDSPSDVNLEDFFSIDLNDCKVCQGEKVPFLPSQKKLNWGNRGTADVWRGNYNNGRKIGGGVTERGFDRICIWETDGDITCDIVDGNSAVVGQEVEDGLAVVGLHDGYLRGMQTPIKQRQPMEVKRQGVTISKGHKNYELMLSLQIGIRHSVGKPAPAALLDLKSSAFAQKERAWIKFPPEGTKYTPSHQSCEFKWKDYCPLVFRTLRKLFKIDPADYMMSICGNGALRELSSPGKSGSFFYMTHDDRYMIKTLKKSEVKVLLRMLPAYYNHVRTFENTLVTKFLGLHCVRLSGSAQKKVYFVIMGNLFCSNYTIHRRYDLKGSSHGRKTNRPESEIDANTTLKDLDLNFIFRLQKAWLQELHRQVDRDCDFLEQERIMDYSLLVGLHFTEASFPGDLPMKVGWTSGVETLAGKNESEQAAGATLRLCSLGIDQVLSGPTRWASAKLGLNMPARVERTVRRSNCESQLIGEMTGEFYDVIMFFGIIDILQDYDIIKKLEHAYKSFHYDPTSISAVDPKQYSKRFHDFICKVFREDT